jgi:hypothetical protein
MALGLTARIEPASAAAVYVEATDVDCAATGILSPYMNLDKGK